MLSRYSMFSRLNQLQTYPFSLLLYLEWILLVTSGLGELPEHFLMGGQYKLPSSIILSSASSLVSLLFLGLVGLRLPKKNSLNKWLYVFLQLGIIWLPIILKVQVIPLFIPFLIVVMRNCQIFKLRECYLANIFVFLAVVPSLLLSFSNSYQEWQLMISQIKNITLEEFETQRNISHLGNLFLMGLSIAFIWILVNTLLREYKSQQQLAIAREQLRLYALKAEDRAIVNERNRIAREIHDSVGHTLTAQTIQLNNAIALWQKEPNEAYQYLNDAKKLVKTALTEIRHSVATLRVAPLQGKDISTAIRLLFQEFSGNTGIVPNYQIDLNHPLTEEIKLTLYRLVQEALTNITKHSKATEVNVKINTFTQYLYLFIADNGQGFCLKQNTTGFGLQGMYERVMALNGKINISSNVNCGCIISVTIPRQTLFLVDNNQLASNK